MNSVVFQPRAIGLASLGLSVFAAWMVLHPYWGITHDSILYSLLALAHVHPEGLSNDVFLRFGSQDRFTVFSPLFAAMIRISDLPIAAALLTGASEAALFGFAWLLARRFMPAATAVFAVGLLVAVPGYYGSGHLFSFTEDFLTARLPAEALVLAALAAALARRPKTAVVSIVGATIVHPIIAFGGVLLLLVLYADFGNRKLQTAVAAVLLIAAVGVATVAPIGPFARFDSQYLDIVIERTRYLFVSRWSLDDWVRLGNTICVLSLGALSDKRSDVRAVCTCTIATAITGIALTYVWCDWLHTVLPTQMQFWRTPWISAVIAILLSPVIALEYWTSRSSLRRAALLFAGCALLLRADSGAGFAALFSLACAAAAHRYSQFNSSKYIFYGSLVSFALTLALTLGDGVTPPVLGIAALTAAWWMSQRPFTAASVSLACAAVLACIAAAPSAYRSWTSSQFSAVHYARYAVWRDHLPPNAEVLWPERPVGAWYLLNRPSYWSQPQLAGSVFSRAAAIEMDRRTNTIRAALLQSGELAKDSDSVNRLRHWTPGTLDSLDAVGLSLLCADRDLGYVVTTKRLGPLALPPLTPDPAWPNSHLYLYSCKDIRG